MTDGVLANRLPGNRSANRAPAMVTGFPEMGRPVLPGPSRDVRLQAFLTGGPSGAARVDRPPEER